MDTGFDDFFAQQDKLMALPEEDVDSYLVRRAKYDEPPFQLGNLPSLLCDSELLADPSSDPDPVHGRFRNPPVDFDINTADPVASPLPRTPVKGSAIDASDEPAPAASRSRRDLSPRRIVLTKPKRATPALNVVQSSPIDTFSPVASSTPARPPPDKVVEESPLLGKRPHDETDGGPTKATKPKSKGKGKAVDPAPQHTSPIESPRFDASTPGRTSKRPRESGGSPSPLPKKKILRAGVLPTSPINSAVFPPNTGLPPILNRQGSVTVSSHQLHKRPRDDRVIKIKSMLPPPVEVFVADTSVIESFDTSPSKPPTTAKQTGPVNNEKKPRVPVETPAVETSFLTSPVTSPEKQSTVLPPPPPPLRKAQRAQVKNIVDSTVASVTSPENSRDEPASNAKDVAPLPGQAVKTIGITKLRPAATTILPPEAGPSKSSSTTMPVRSKSTLGQVQKKKTPVIPIKKGKEKPPKMTPVEYAEMLIEKNDNPNRKIPNVSQHLRGRKIFYVGVDMRYAGDATKKKMEYILKYGGTLVPRYDPEIVTVIVTDGGRKATTEACGIKKVTDIPMTIPTVRWPWVLTGERSVRKRPTIPGALPPKPKAPADNVPLAKMDYFFYHAAFSERIEAGDNIPKPQPKPIVQKELTVEELNTWDMGISDNELTTGGETSDEDDEPEAKRRKTSANWDAIRARYAAVGMEYGKPAAKMSTEGLVFNPDDFKVKPMVQPKPKARGQERSRNVASGSSRSALKTAEGKDKQKAGVEDPLAEFYAEAKAHVEQNGRAGWCSEEVSEDSDAGSALTTPGTSRKGGVATTSGWTCDNKPSASGPCPNQDVVDKLRELQGLHRAKPGAENGWRVFSYNKSIRALLNYPTRIKSYAEARTIRGVGEKTALKIMEVINTGILKRIGYEDTEDVKANKLFQGVFGVGVKTAYMWYSAGARTLEGVLAGKGGIKLTSQQEIGIRYYDDINERMPRSEVTAVFQQIKRIAIKIDPKLFVECMGSYRRGSDTCGDIDVIITRPVEDGKTHSGAAKKLWQACHARGIITDDLVMPDDWSDLELIYRGLCRKDTHSKRRRIDFLSVPWEARGAALLYYTGDDIFNRSLRLKARKNGMALNQRGLYGGVVRDLNDPSKKTISGQLLASETEREIFEILGVPWQDPHERVRANFV